MPKTAPTRPMQNQRANRRGQSNTTTLVQLRKIYFQFALTLKLMVTDSGILLLGTLLSQLTEFRSLEGQDIYTGEKIVPIKLDLRVNHTLIKDQFLWDLNNFESDPEEFAKIFCRDLGIEDPEVGPAVAFAIREQLCEFAIQGVVSAKETRISKKGRRGAEHVPLSKASGIAVDTMKLFGNRSSVIRKRREWDIYEPIIDLLSNEEVDALEARET